MTDSDIGVVVEALRQPRVAAALARLVQQDDEATRYLDPEEEITGRSREAIMIYYNASGEGATEYALLLADVYTILKDIGNKCVTAKHYIPGGGESERAIDNIARLSLKGRDVISSASNVKKLEERKPDGQ